MGFFRKAEIEASFDESCSFHNPSLPLKVGTPLSLEIPEPVRKTILFERVKESFKRFNEFGGELIDICG